MTNPNSPKSHSHLSSHFIILRISPEMNAEAVRAWNRYASRALALLYLLVCTYVFTKRRTLREHEREPKSIHIYLYVCACTRCFGIASVQK